MIETSFPAEKIEKLKTLLKCDDIRFLTKQGGGNSVVFGVEADGKKWAVKSYPPYAPNQRDRLAAELTVYRFLNQYDVPFVPILKTFSEEERWLIIEWISGEIPREYSSSDINQAVEFLRHIAKLNTSSEAMNLLPAAEACLSLTILCNQIEQRFQRLTAFAENEPLLAKFLFDDFYPVFEGCQQKAIEGYRANKMDPDAEIRPEQRSLIPADFGFHNTIRDEAGRLYFFDFDYFGWDDPVKLLADILWHPKMKFSKEQEEKIIRDVSNVYSKDQLFLPRFYYTRPLFGLRWTLILLNEFIPAFWLNRQHASVHSDQAEAKKTQLERAKQLLLTVQQIGSLYDITATTSL